MVLVHVLVLAVLVLAEAMAVVMQLVLVVLLVLRDVGIYPVVFPCLCCHPLGLNGLSPEFVANE